MSPERDRRRPHRVYGHGSEPDYRFTLANERTLLAWLRTALALLAAGAAMGALVELGHPVLERVLAVVLSLAGVVIALLAWRRWMRVERAMREGTPMPSPSGALFLIVVLVLVGFTLAAVLAWP